jgi:hypothetical protein
MVARTSKAVVLFRLPCMGLSARKRFPTAASAYLEAYNAVEISASKAQALVDAFKKMAIALTEAGAAYGRSDAWKTAKIAELAPPRGKTSNLFAPFSLARIPTSKQLLDAIAEWRKKREYLDYLWSSLAAEDRASLKSPATLD